MHIKCLQLNDGNETLTKSFEKSHYYLKLYFELWIRSRLDLCRVKFTFLKLSRATENPPKHLSSTGCWVAIRIVSSIRCNSCGYRYQLNVPISLSISSHASLNFSPISQTTNIAPNAYDTKMLIANSSTASCSCC